MDQPIIYHTYSPDLNHAQSPDTPRQPRPHPDSQLAAPPPARLENHPHFPTHLNTTYSTLPCTSESRPFDAPLTPHRSWSFSQHTSHITTPSWRTSDVTPLARNARLFFRSFCSVLVYPMVLHKTLYASNNIDVCEGAAPDRGPPELDILCTGYPTIIHKPLHRYLSSSSSLLSRVIRKSMSPTHEPSSELLHISESCCSYINFMGIQWFLHWTLHQWLRRCSTWSRITWATSTTSRATTSRTMPNSTATKSTTGIYLHVSIYLSIYIYIDR